jgi:hypothetical protein
VQILRRFRDSRVHEHDEPDVFGEQSHLALGVTPVRAVGVGVDQLADGQPVGGFPGEILA